ncbi:MAG: hypothetical protein HY691_05585, partial [Chloroflexi bacterium]|nr:hypothetical protein [Chloroflexota bacterium]
MRSTATVCLVALALLVALSLVACAPAPLLSVPPASVAVSPDGAGRREALVRYQIGAAALLSAYLEDGAGRRFVLRQDARRPPGAYALPLDGTVAVADGSVRRRALPDGSYTLVLAARDGQGNTVERRVAVRLAGADTRPPALRSVAAQPTAISPYDPRYADEAMLSYGLDKPAEVRVALLWPDSRRTLLAPPAWREPGEHVERWSGLVGGAYLPDGTYRFEVEARDRAGNVVAEQGEIAVAGTLPPDARVVGVRFSPQRLLAGEPLRVEVAVRNVGPVPLRTYGPPPGFTYASGETFAGAAGGQFASRRNYWRVGVDWTAGPAMENAHYPYRWGLGRDLQPGEETTVVGYVRLREPYRTLRVYAALIREGASYHVERTG